jgi:hypothetical protein
MSESQSESAPSIAEVAAEPPKKSAEKQREVVGDQPDIGDEVPADNAQ